MNKKLTLLVIIILLANIMSFASAAFMWDAGGTTNDWLDRFVAF